MLIRKIQQYTGIGALLVLAACGGKNQQQQGAAQQAPPAVAVTTFQVEPTNASYADLYPATVTALEQTEIRPQVNGYVTGIFFKDGARVSKGQKLYTIDQQAYEATYNQAQANLAVQEANLVKAEKDAARYRELDKHDAIAKQQVDNAEAALEAAKRTVEAARANVRAVQTNVRYTTLTAPFSGTIGISQVKVGSPVYAGQTILNTISSNDPIAVDIPVDQREIYQFSKMQQAGTKAGDSTFKLQFGDDIYPFNGKINLIDRAVDPQTGSIKVRVVFPNGKDMLKPGMSGTLLVHRSSKDAVVIPYKAVTEQLGEFFVYVVNGDKVSQVKVQLGQPLGANIIVKEGLKPGDVIVVQGVQNLREGAQIKVAQDTSAQKKP
jgi:membrane fusion protein, multidrug efflux system